MKILLVDIYPNRNYRLIKDTNGAYGTGNDFGDGIFTRLLKFLTKRNLFWPTTYTAYTIAVLRSQGHSVDYSFKILDGYDVYIFTSSVITHESEIEQIEKLSKKTNKILSIGPFSSNNSKKYLEAGSSVISNEPEFYFLNNKIENLSYDNPLILNDYDLKNDVDDLPMPAWDLFIKKGLLTYGVLTQEVSIPLLATRGCPYSCSHYCVYPLAQGKKVRARDPIKIVEEIKHWRNKYNVKKFVFRDPVFSINRKHTITLCNEIISQKLDVDFVVETHLNNLDDEILPLLKQSGMSMVKVGIESSDEFVLKSSKRKSIAADLQLSRIRKLEKLKIKVVAMYIIGMLGDTVQTANATIKYAKSLNTYLAQCSIFTPYPGTPLYSEFKDKLITNKFEDFNQYNLVFQHPDYTNKLARKTMNKFYNNYYLRPSWIIKYLRTKIF